MDGTTKDDVVDGATQAGTADIAEASASDGKSNAATGSAAGPMLGSFAATGLIQTMQAVTGILLARVLGPSGRGELAAVVLWPMVLTAVGNLGLSQAATYFIARARDREGAGAVVGSAFVLLVVVAALLVGIGSVVVPLALRALDPDVVSTARVFLVVFIPVNLLAVVTMSLINGQHRFRWFQALRILMIGGILVSLLTVDVAGELTVQSGAACYAFASAIAALTGLFLVLKSVWGDLAIRVREIKQMLAFGLKSQLSTSMWSLNERADQLVISIFFSATSLGLYVVAVTLTSLTTLVGFSFALVALPVIARVELVAERRRIARLIVSATLVGAAAVSLPIFILEPWIIKLLFGAEFAGATGVGRVLLVAGIVFALNRVLEALLQAVGRPLESSIGEGVALAITAGGLAALLPALGIMGAGVTSFLAYFASSAFMLRRSARALGVSAIWLLIPERGTLKRARSLIGLVPGFGSR